MEALTVSPLSFVLQQIGSKRIRGTFHGDFVSSTSQGPDISQTQTPTPLLPFQTTRHRRPRLPTASKDLED